MVIILKFMMSGLHNEEHYQFHTNLKGLIDRYNPGTLNIQDAYAQYNLIYSDEGKVLDVVRKSVFSDNIAKADQVRDSTFRGMRDAIKSSGRHFRPEVRQAAARLHILVSSYGDLPSKSFDDETAAINHLNTELTASFAADVATVGLSEWIAELQANNDDFNNLTINRYSEDASKPLLQMRQVRKQLDVAYYAITDRIDAHSLLNGTEIYTQFVNELNARIEYFANTLAMRQGHNGKSTDMPTDIKG